MEEKNEIKTTCFEVRNSERDSLAIPADLARCKESVKNSSKADVSMESDNTTYGAHRTPDLKLEVVKGRY